MLTGFWLLGFITLKRSNCTDSESSAEEAGLQGQDYSDPKKKKGCFRLCSRSIKAGKMENGKSFWTENSKRGDDALLFLLAEAMKSAMAAGWVAAAVCRKD